MKRGWLNYLQDQLLFAAVCVLLFDIVVLGAELLHFVSNGRVPSLVEYLVESPPKHKAPVINDDDDDNEDRSPSSPAADKDHFGPDVAPESLSTHESEEASS